MTKGTNNGDSSGISSDRSDIPVHELKTLIHEFYGLDVAEARVLGGEIDHNLRVTDAQGRTFLAKLTPASQPSAIIDWQEAILLRLAAQPISAAVPQILRTTAGLTRCEVQVGDRAYLLRLLSWIEGDLMATRVEHPASVLRELGRVAAEIPQALEGLVHPKEFGKHHWLVVRSREAIQDTLDAVTEHEHRQSVLTILGWFDEAAKVFDRLPVATVHQDLNDFNVLVADATGRARLAGVLDFNDAVRTIRVAELAVAGAYAMLRKQDPVKAFCDVVAGYQEILELTEDELKVVFPLAATRLCVNATTWTKRTSMENHLYGESRKQATWPAVAQLAKLDPDAVARQIRKAQVARTTRNPKFAPNIPSRTNGQ